MSGDGTLDRGFIVQIAWQDKETYDTLSRLDTRLLMLLVRRAANFVNQSDDAFGTAVVEFLSGSHPAPWQVLTKSFLSIAIDALHHVADKTKKKLILMRGLDYKERVDQILVGVLTFVDLQDRVATDQDALHSRLGLEEMRSDLQNLRMV